ncbi:enoyl-CoA hydratase-related protein [Bradyrhizobium uaiense]|uniref:Enoyl-CoA hydratase/isomerase family protein n=1 Tax=Bradyrhizobium uaiense TaxID=2594946 RepID=A0A6P1BHK9_9BRAD|nr:enoyl-CoA hydratase-related protein [Bradyrhizobium uaiense]NEU97101.1 hypothetical protein [Bradyrhizobium uaiense]
MTGYPMQKSKSWSAAEVMDRAKLFTAKVGLEKFGDAYPRPTVAAINGHAYAGGFITAIDYDHRIASKGPLQFALNEVPIGIPMPAVYCEIIKHAIGFGTNAVRSDLQPCRRDPDGRRPADRRAGQADRSGRRLGGAGTSGLLHGLRLCHARASGRCYGGD